MHEQFLLAALQQALLGRGVCAPNPAVGAVAVHNGGIIAQAFHSGAGLPHAEQLLLEKLPASCAGVTVYVTLEPCNHWGRTPPCVDALIARGVKRVVYAYRDPNPVVASNDTPARFLASGIEAIHHPLPAIDEFYQSYTYWLQTGRPWVTVKIAQTLDGKIAGKGGARTVLSNALCAEFTHEQRRRSDVLLTTAATVNQDDPLLNVRQKDGVMSKPVALLDRCGRVNPDAQLHATAAHCFVYHAEGRVVSEPSARCSFHPILSDENGLDLTAILEHLGRLGYHDVWVEAGAQLFNALHRAGLVNRTYVYLVPRVLGEEATSLYHDGVVFSAAKKIEWRVMGDNVMAILDWSHY
jgi:diaminohydroxyphosphoribosylaminopyrimidine deaminase/5-amino-6-(5-phosphoribosylamino)uracil reductase